MSRPGRRDDPGRGPRALAIVPARLGSTRLPRKMLLRETGHYLFEHTVRNAAACGALERVVLATDAQEVRAAAEEAGIEALLTSAAHRSGTDRVREALDQLLARGEGPFDVIVNVQGDEPRLPAEDLVRLIGAFEDPEVSIATLRAPIVGDAEARDPAVVKVVVDAEENALYFSRAPIPHLGPRSTASPSTCAETAGGPARPSLLRRHVGVYAFRPETLRAVTNLAPGRLEQAESLEQLRWLEAGYSIRVLEVARSTVGIDTPEDYALFVAQAAQSPTALPVHPEGREPTP